MAVTDIKVATNGVAYLAPSGTTLPTDADTALDAAFYSLGEITQDGLEQALNVETSTIDGWDGQTLRVLQTKTELTFKLTFLESTEEVLEAFYGTSITSQTTASKLVIGTPDPTPKVLAITLTDESDDTFQRFIVPRAVVSDRGTITHQSGDAVMYEFTFTALYDSTIGGLAQLQFDADLTA